MAKAKMARTEGADLEMMRAEYERLKAAIAEQEQEQRDQLGQEAKALGLVVITEAEYKALKSGRKGKAPRANGASRTKANGEAATDEEILAYFKKNPGASVGSAKKSLGGRTVATKPLVDAGLLKKTGGHGTGVTFKAV